MSMHLEGPWLTNNNTRKRKVKMTKRKQAELVEYNKERKSNGLEPLESFVIPRFDRKAMQTTRTPPIDLHADRSTAHIKSLDPTNMSPCLVHSIMDPKNLAKETPAVREAILAKSRRIAPPYSKGAAQYLTDDTDPTDIGRKK